VAHPTIVTESGRAIAAYHSVLVFNVLGVAEWARPTCRPSRRRTPSSRLSTCRNLPLADAKNLLESYTTRSSARPALKPVPSATFRSTALHRRKPLLGDFAEIQKQARELDYFPEELEGIDAMLSDTYFCNFSLFQSMPDSWPSSSFSPFMPTPAEEEPTRPAVLGDITCDSDGKVDAFIDRRDGSARYCCTRSTEAITTWAFLLGAYQGNNWAPAQPVRRHQRRAVRLGPAGDVMLDSVIKGDTVREC